MKSKNATYQGTYLLTCFECDPLEDHARFFQSKVKGKKNIENIKNSHDNHNWILLHSSRVRIYFPKSSRKKPLRMCLKW